MNKKDETLRIAAKAFLIIFFGGKLTQNEAKMFADLCCLTLPMKYRFKKYELVAIESGVRQKLEIEQARQSQHEDNCAYHEGLLCTCRLSQ